MTENNQLDPLALLRSRPISYSQMSDFLTCRQRWFLTYVLGIRPRFRAPAMEIGDAVHRGLASFLAGGSVEDGITDWYKKTSDKIPFDDPGVFDHMNDLRETAVLVADRALAGLRELGFYTVYDENDEPIVEREYVIDVKGWKTGLVAKVDWVAYDPKLKNYWVVDFKTRNSFYTDSDELANLQSIIYQYALLKSGLATAGALTFQIKSTPQKPPKLNKDGSMSRAAVACDWQFYKDALIEAGLDPNDYLDMIPKLSGQESVRLTETIRTDKRVKQLWSRVVEPTISTIAGAVDHYDKYRETSEKTLMLYNLSARTCSGCKVKSICHGDLDGRSVFDELSRDYSYNALGNDRFFQF